MKITIQTLLHADEMKEALLIQPLIQYDGYFFQKIEQSSKLGKLAYIILNLFTGIIAYPVLGALAAIGVIGKVIQIRLHNYNVKKEAFRYLDAFSDITSPSLPEKTIPKNNICSLKKEFLLKNRAEIKRDIVRVLGVLNSLHRRALFTATVDDAKLYMQLFTRQKGAI